VVRGKVPAEIDIGVFLGFKNHHLFVHSTMFACANLNDFAFLSDMAVFGQFAIKSRQGAQARAGWAEPS